MSITLSRFLKPPRETKLINLRNPPRVRELIQKNKSKGSDAAGLRNRGFEKSPEFHRSDTVVSETLP